MLDEITQKITPISRRKRIEELEAYEDLRRAAERAGILGGDIKSALDRVVKMAGDVRVTIEAA